MTPEPWSVADSGCRLSYMKISDSIKSLFRRRPLSAEELAARAEAETEREQIRQEKGLHKAEAEAQIPDRF
jgi:hypothetical protein